MLSYSYARVLLLEGILLVVVLQERAYVGTPIFSFLQNSVPHQIKYHCFFFSKRYNMDNVGRVCIALHENKQTALFAGIPPCHNSYPMLTMPCESVPLVSY